MGIKIVRDNNEFDEQIRKVIIKAFKQDNEAILVENIKKNSDFYVSFVAIDEDTNNVVGHVMVSPMLLNGQKEVLSLAPVSVLEEYENRGIGSQLIKTIIAEIQKEEKYKLLTVLGSDHYYNRFGFKGYDSKRFKLPFEIEDRFFQLMVLGETTLDTLEGNFDYPAYFGV